MAGTQALYGGVMPAHTARAAGLHRLFGTRIRAQKRGQLHSGDMVRRRSNADTAREISAQPYPMGTGTPCSGQNPQPKAGAFFMRADFLSGMELMQIIFIAKILHIKKKNRLNPSGFGCLPKSNRTEYSWREETQKHTAIHQ